MLTASLVTGGIAAGRVYAPPPTITNANLLLEALPTVALCCLQTPHSQMQGSCAAAPRSNVSYSLLRNHLHSVVDVIKMCDLGPAGHSEEGREERVGSTGGCESQTAGAAAGDHLQLHHSIFCALFVSKPPLFSSVSWHLVAT